MHYRADFHIHSCLSPCASLEMSPARIVAKARTAGLNAIALTDHNCTFNLPAFAEVCSRSGMECLFGMEVTTTEEVHVLCLFDQLERAMELGALVYDSLPALPHLPDQFGDQPIIDEKEQIIGYAEKFLISASGYAIGPLLEQVHAMGGLFIPAHIDRTVFGIISQLGFLPDEKFDAVELTPRGDRALARGYPVVRHSDAHEPRSVGAGCTEYDLDSLTVAQLRHALQSRQI